MKNALIQLETILDRLANPEALEAEELGHLVRDWDTAIRKLDAFPEDNTLSTSEKAPLRFRLKRIIQRVPDIQSLLIQNKSDIAKRLFSENRRFKALSNGYGAMQRNSRSRQTV